MTDMGRVSRLDRRSERVLVTGGAGFVGSHLCDRLIAQGKHVICVDNFQTGSADNVAHLLSHPRFSLQQHDVLDLLEIEVDQIYNLACPASPVHYQADPVRTVRTSVVGAVNMLELARRTGARILQASTSEVYGDPEVHPQPESYWGNVNPIGPRACYDEGKRCAETLFFAYHARNVVSIKVARIFNTYGPRMHPNDGRIVSNFMVQALQNRPITVYGDGTQTRSFCYVDDMTDGLIRLMESDAAVVGPINLGNPVEIPVLELADLVREVTRSSAPVVFRPLPDDDPRRRRPEIHRARTLLGWQPRTDLRTGLRRTADYFRAKLIREPASRLNPSPAVARTI